MNVRAVNLFLAEKKRKIRYLLSLLGVVMIPSFPLIGIFDTILFESIHKKIASAFFVSMGLYAFVFGITLKNIELPSKYDFAKELLLIFGVLLLGSVGLMGVLIGLGISPAIVEWGCMILCVSYFVVGSLMNPYYEEIKKNHIENVSYASGFSPLFLTVLYITFCLGIDYLIFY